METTAQIIGFVALACAILSFQQKTHKGIMIFQLLAGSTFVVHFFMLGAYTGALLNAVGVARSIVFVNKGRRWADNRVWLAVFCVLSVLAGVVTWNGALTLLPITGMLLTTVAFWITTPKYVRFVSFWSSPLWMIYNFLNSSYAGIITEAFVMCSIIVAVIRLDLRKAQKSRKV